MVTADQLQARYSPLYDTKSVAGSASTGASLTFFQNLMSTSGRAITNMKKAGELPAPERFEVYALRLALLECGGGDIQDLYQGFGVEMKVSGKTVLEGPIEYFAGGAGIYGFATTTATTTTISQLSNGVPDPRAVALMPAGYQIPIEAGEPFEVVLSGTAFTAAAAIVIRAMLEGIHYWPIN